MESGHVRGTETGSDLKTHQLAGPGEDNEKQSSSTSSSGEAIELGSTVTSASNAGVSTPVKDEHSEEDIPVSSMPNNGQPGDPTQATERPAGGSPSGTQDRIPSYVFARTKSTSPMEWSVASNESLFSIQMGNMSFTKDLSWMTKSGELGYTPDSTFSGPLIDLPSYQTPTSKYTEIARKSGNLNEGYAANEAAAAETMREVLREKESQHKENIAKESPRSHCTSDRLSDASVKSFAFPVLTTGDSNKSGSWRINTKKKKLLSRPSTPRRTPQTPPETPTPKATSPHTPKPLTPKSHMPNETRNAGLRRWFSCFSCCAFCS